jgi:hypothetical protein
VTELLGVRGWYRGDLSLELKKAALLFKHIIVKHVHNQGICDEQPEVNKELNWLREKGVVLKAPELSYYCKRFPWLRNYDERILEGPTAMTFRALIAGDPEEYRREVDNVYSAAADVYARVASAALTDAEQTVIPTLVREPKSHKGLPTKRSEVLHLIYDELPMPGQDTSWDAILDWRDDSDARGKLSVLRDWMNKRARDAAPISELEDELAAHLFEYKRYMAVHHRTFEKSRVEAFCVAAAECLEVFPRIKVSPAVKVFFKARNAQLELTHEELNAPHSEVAYIVATQERFGQLG